MCMRVLSACTFLYGVHEVTAEAASGVLGLELQMVLSCWELDTDPQEEQRVLLSPELSQLLLLPQKPE